MQHISQEHSCHQYVCSRSVRSSHTTSMYAAVQSGASIPPVIKKQPQQQMSNEQQYHIYVCSSRIRSSHACMQHQISQEQSYCQYICRSDIRSNTNIIYIYMQQINKKQSYHQYLCSRLVRSSPPVCMQQISLQQS